MDKCSIQDHFNFTSKERELGWIANPAQRQHPQSQPNVAVSNILHDGGRDGNSVQKNHWMKDKPNEVKYFSLSVMKYVNRVTPNVRATPTTP